ncbi:HAD-IB family hydrolase [Kordiimonas gwangyangensis]|uniref:HAD-IB family hydrolase n=1 Tax=Kordiimonas gwangyangensis TaxID=288022 RepID=UPI000373BC8F|nr:HAD-IB family hydrolase [Kordiimonas gwangyangensis]
MHDGLTLTESQLAIGAGATVANARVSTGFLPALSSAIVLAGERPERDMLGAQGGIHGKAMAPIAGKPMIAHVVATLARSGLVGEILISSNSDLTGEAELTHAAAGIPLRHVPTRTTICSSVKAAYDCVPKGRGALVTTADNPLLSVEALSDFIMAAAGHDGLSLGLVPDHVIRAKYPTSKRTYYRFRDAAVSGANLFYFRGDAATNVLGFWERAESHRKKPWKILSAFGWGTVMGMALRRLSLKDGFARAGKVVGCPVNAHLLKEAEAAMDVDSPRDFVAAERILVDRMKHTRGPQKWGGSGTQSFAVFDLDRTLTKRGTFTPFLLSTRKGMVARSVLMLRLLRHMILYKAKRISRLELKNRMLTLAFKGFSEQEIEAASARFAQKTVAKGLRPGAELALAMHRMEGDTMVLATAAIDLYVHAIANALGFECVVCTGTTFTGDERAPVALSGANCYGDDKFLQLRDALLGTSGLTRDRIFVSFYSDHHTDMPLLEWADVPVVVCPGIKTHSMAVVRQMKIVEW